MKLPKCFFGWENFKWVVRELNKMYSGRIDSFYSQKRIQSGIAFIILQQGMIHYMYKNVDGMPMTEMAIWAGIEGVICGYYLNKIEQNNKPTNDEPAK